MLSIRTYSPATRVSLAALIVLAVLPAPARCHFQDLCPEPDHCLTDAECNDGDPCTQDFCDPAVDGLVEGEGCCEHEALMPCIDAFLCYNVAASKGAAKFAPVPSVRVADPLEDLFFKVTESRALCTPADRDGAGVHDPVTHLDRYQIAPVAKRAPRAMARGVKAETTLGTVLLDIVVGDKLLVPAAENLAAPPAVLDGTVVDHFKCYDAKPSKATPKFPKDMRLTLADQFTGTPKAFEVTGPAHLCTAADTNGEGFKDSCAALLCYRVKAAAKQPRFSRVKGIWMHDRFGLRQVDVVGEDEACLPAVVNDRTCLPQGFACSADADCSTGHCADGVCCESACDAPCYACVGSLTDQPHGTCAPIDSPGTTDTAPVSLCAGSTGCAAGACVCDGIGHCTPSP